jgi:hypothetical protein
MSQGRRNISFPFEHFNPTVTYGPYGFEHHEITDPFAAFFRKVDDTHTSPCDLLYERKGSG